MSSSDSHQSVQVYSKIAQNSPMAPAMSQQSALVNEESNHGKSLWPCCFFCFRDDNDKRTGIIIVLATLHYFSIAISAIPLMLLINTRIAGAAEDPNSESAFVGATVSFVHSILSFLFGRYTAGLGDYVGRKPVVIMSSVFFIISRILYLQAKSAPGFYVAAVIGGVFECYYFAMLAWVCDLYHEPSRRSKRIGVFTGILGGFSFTFGVPIGSVLGTKISPSFPLRVSAVLAAISMICVVFIPVNDKLGLKELPSASHSTFLGGRHFPPDWRAYAMSHFPFSLGGWKLIMAAQHPTDWMVNFLMHSCTGVLNLIYIQFCFAVYHWSAIGAAGAVLVIGLCLGIESPTLLDRYNPVPLAFYAICSFTTGFFLISISGTGIAAGQFIGIAGIVCVACGVVLVPSLHSIIYAQYPRDVKGDISGVLNQQNDSSLLPAYIMSLGFTLSLRRNGEVYWPGSTFAAVSVTPTSYF
jgi:MFS family permease